MIKLDTTISYEEPVVEIGGDAVELAIEIGTLISAAFITLNLADEAQGEAFRKAIVKLTTLEGSPIWEMPSEEELAQCKKETPEGW